MADRIDLNTADRETLSTLPGIGNALAERIVAFREEVHPFEEVIELAAVSGISERMVRNVEERLTVGNVQAGEESEAVGEEASPGPLAVPEPARDFDEGEDVPLTVEPEAESEEEPAGPAEEAEEEVTSEERERISETTETGAEAEAPAPQAVATAEAVEIAERASVAPEATPAPRRGLGCTLLGVLAGALTGAALTLFFLFLLNGTLLFGERQQVSGLEQEVLMQDRDQEALGAEVADTSADLATVAAAQETVAASQGSTAGEVEELAGDLDELENDVMPAIATLEAQTAAQATRLSGVAAAAASFDAFLTSMRDLLIDLQGLPPTPTGTPSPSPSPSPSATDVTATPSGTSPAADELQTTTPVGPTPTPSWTPPATRTPRPTVTPIVRPTATPSE